MEEQQKCVIETSLPPYRNDTTGLVRILELEMDREDPTKCWVLYHNTKELPLIDKESQGAHIKQKDLLELLERYDKLGRFCYQKEKGLFNNFIITILYLKYNGGQKNDK